MEVDIAESLREALHDFIVQVKPPLQNVPIVPVIENETPIVAEERPLTPVSFTVSPPFPKSTMQYVGQVADALHSTISDVFEPLKEYAIQQQRNAIEKGKKLAAACDNVDKLNEMTEQMKLTSDDIDASLRPLHEQTFSSLTHALYLAQILQQKTQ